MSEYPLSIILHGGAGRLSRDTARKKLPYLRLALDAGWEKLRCGAPGEEAAEAAIRVMEECEFFNAGYGGYPNANGIVLLDVGMMNGEKNFVSIVNMRRIKFPSSVAVDMMKRYTSLMTVWTYEHEKEIDAATAEQKERYGLVATHDDLIPPYVRKLMRQPDRAEISSHGTVGCVVRDAKGRLCAGTSTGGINLKVNGRIGDTPIIGAGVYADNDVCALSTTGHGESFLRCLLTGYVVGEFRREIRATPNVFLDSPELAREILKKEFKEMESLTGGTGALITIPARGLPTWAFNAEMVSLAMRSGSENSITDEDVLIALKSGERLQE